MFLSSYSNSGYNFLIQCPVTPCPLHTPTDTIHLVAANMHGAAELKTGPHASPQQPFSKKEQQACTSPLTEVIPH